jgi:hypothetical protein
MSGSSRRWPTRSSVVESASRSGTANGQRRWRPA